MCVLLSYFLLVCLSVCAFTLGLCPSAPLHFFCSLPLSATCGTLPTWPQALPRASLPSSVCSPICPQKPLVSRDDPLGLLSLSEPHPLQPSPGDFFSWSPTCLAPPPLKPSPQIQMTICGPQSVQDALPPTACLLQRPRERDLLKVRWESGHSRD